MSKIMLITILIPFLEMTRVAPATNISVPIVPEPLSDIEPAFAREFNGRNYLVFKPRKIWWLSAQKLCQRFSGGQLAVPSSPDTYRFLLSIIREYYVRLSLVDRFDTRGFHIGARLIDNAFWIPENLSFCFDEPKNQGACAEISTANGFCVNDFRCTEYAVRGVICEVPIMKIDQPDRDFDQSLVCLQPRNYTRPKNHSLISWIEAERECRKLGLRLARFSNSSKLWPRLMARRVPTAFDLTRLDGYWDGSNVTWCSGYPNQHNCALKHGICFKSYGCQTKAIRRFCCKLHVVAT